MEKGPIILFDGVCNLCNSAVNFLIKRDPRAIFRFASLQSSVGKALLEQLGFPTSKVATIVLVENDRYFTESTAVLKIASSLGKPWSFLYGLILVPKPFRDGAYRLFARYRYNWFGRTEQCMVPTPEVRHRFLSLDEK